MQSVLQVHSNVLRYRLDSLANSSSVSRVIGAIQPALSAPSTLAVIMPPMIKANSFLQNLHVSLKELKFLRYSSTHHNSALKLFCTQYNAQNLRRLSLICFYGADTIKFNAFISAVKRADSINQLEIAQLRKDNDTLYSLSKLFKPNKCRTKRSHHGHGHHHGHQRLSWDFYESVVVSFGVEFRHFFHGERPKVVEMQKLMDLILDTQLSLNESKDGLLHLIRKYISKVVPEDVLWIVVEFSLGIDCLNVVLLQWNLFDGEELFLLFQTLKYFERKYGAFTEEHTLHGSGRKQIHRKIEWFDPDWYSNAMELHC